MITQFFTDIGKNVQVTTLDAFLGWTEEIQALCERNPRTNLYFCGSVAAGLKTRCADEDIREKSYTFFDFDLRSLYPAITDQEICEYAETLKQGFAGTPFLQDWRYMVYTGNGLHVYYCGTPVVPERKLWSRGMKYVMGKCLALTGDRPDPACCNVGRLARVPGSWNVKAEPKLTKIVLFQERTVDLSLLHAFGRKAEQDALQQAKDRAASLQIQVDGTSTYAAIQSLPIGNLTCRLMGWELRERHFFEPGSAKPKGCFVSSNGNFLLHGGTDHLPSDHEGYSPFELVKCQLRLTNAETFHWFCEHYAEIALVAERERQAHMDQKRVLQVTPASIQTVLQELQHSTFENLSTVPFFDPHRLFLRGTLTRIGAFSNIGKSFLIYYLTNRLLKHGYRGLFFSTETRRFVVLAFLERVRSGKKILDILEHKAFDPEQLLSTYQHLAIYDSLQTKNSLETIRAMTLAAQPDFVFIDFAQAITPIQKTVSEYDRMRAYAFESQLLAQESGACIIDTSQLSNKALSTDQELSELDFVGYKGAGDLFSSADTCIQLIRKKKDQAWKDLMCVAVRKHKYLPSAEIWLNTDFAAGMIALGQKPLEPQKKSVAKASLAAEKTFDKGSFPPY